MAKKSQIEQLNPFYIEETIKNRIQQLIEVQKKMEIQLQKNTQYSQYSNVKLRAVKSHNTYQYFLRKRGNDTKGEYISKKNKKYIEQIAATEYTEKIHYEIKKNIKILRKFITKYKDENLQQVYKKLPAGKRVLITPVILPAEQYIATWKTIGYPKKYFSENAPKLYTTQGERVRSKSEMILADTLTRNKIPYRYEFPLKMNIQGEERFFHPDFYCLNVRTRQEFAWEHLGMMDDSEYAQNAAEKISIYNQNGYFLGKNLLITMETQTHPLNQKEIENIIEEYLL